MSCTRCPLSEYAISVCVPGRGPKDAPILIYGQNPGRQEDIAGEPFVGKSGKLLVSMLADAGYETKDYFLSSSVRCATPTVDKKQRAPLPLEIDACRFHTTNEIHAIQPKVIIALGDTALRSLTKLSGIKSKRGKSYPLHKDFGYPCEVYVTFHPAAVLRTPILQRTVISDLRRVRDVGAPAEEIRWEWYESQQLQGEYISLDIETIDEERKIVEWPTQIALSDGTTTVVSTGTWPLPRKGQTLVTHNGLNFDLPKLHIPPQGYDTMVLAHLMEETQSLGLESLCVKYLGKHGWKEDRDAAPGTPTLAAYNAKDALYTLELFHHFREELGDRIKIYDHIILPGKHALDACGKRGIVIDGNAVQKEKLDQEVRIVNAYEAVVEQVLLSELDMDDRFGKQLKTKRKVPAFNPNSTDHVGAVLQHLGYILPLTKEGKPSTDIHVLESLTPHPFINALKEYRSATKRMSTYILPYEKAAASEDGRVHNEYTNYKTVTGRTSAMNPNVQNLDRDLKGFFKDMVIVDYSAIESRIAAWIAHEETLLKLFREGYDPHRFFAALFYNKRAEDVTKDERQIAKSANFSQLYLGEEHTLQNYAIGLGIHLDLATCRRLHLAWHQAFPGFRAWYLEVKAELKEKGYVESPTGRRRHFGDVSLLNSYAFDAALREAVNFKVQSFATGDISQLALIECHKATLPVNYFCHDAIGFDMNGMGYLTKGAFEALVQYCMIDMPTQTLQSVFGIELDVPICLEYDYSHSNLKGVAA